MPAGNQNDPDLHEVEPLELWPTCDPCAHGMHRNCLTLTTDEWCTCPLCGWIWPDGAPDLFWRP